MNTPEKNIVVHVVGMGSLQCSLPKAVIPEPTARNNVIVETNYGLDNGVVEEGVGGREEDLPPASWVRHATPADLQRVVSNKEAAKEALGRLADRILGAGIRFKALEAHYSLDRDRLAVLFGCEEEFDLRRLFTLIPVDIKARIEFRQVGARDECAILGGIGPCGRVFCCCSWQKFFNPINIRMAKAQEMPLTPAAINGGCERLKCCLRFEYEQYCDAAKGLPFYGTMVEGDEVRGVVVGRDVLRGILTIRTDDGRYLRLPFAELRVARPESPRPPGVMVNDGNQQDGKGEGEEHDDSDSERS